MVQLEILSGSSAGKVYDLSPLPCTVGRAVDADVRLEEPGVWDRHLQIDLLQDFSFGLTVLPQATAAVNGHFLETAVLRNADVIDAGAVKLRFWLSPTRQRSHRLRETFTWICLVGLCVGQVALVYLLLR